MEVTLRRYSEDLNAWLRFVKLAKQAPSGHLNYSIGDIHWRASKALPKEAFAHFEKGYRELAQTRYS